MTSAAEIVRRSGIGASEVAKILGISPFGDAYTVLAGKKGFAEPQPKTEEQEWGDILAPIIAGVFAHREDVPVQWYDQPVFSKKRPWQFASPDAFILTRAAPGEPADLTPQIAEEARRAGVLECKTTGLHYAGQWDRHDSGPDGIPEYYLVQVEWQMSTLELPVAYVAVLIAGQNYRSYRVEHDPILEEILLEQVEPFYYQCVRGDREPPLGPSPHARNYIRQRYPRHTEKLRPATDRESEWLIKYASVRSAMAVIEQERESLENQLTRAIAEAEGIESPLYTMTWKRTQDRRKTDWQKLALKQLEGYSDDERQGLIQRYTEMLAGYRQIHFKEHTHAK